MYIFFIEGEVKQSRVVWFDDFFRIILIELVRPQQARRQTYGKARALFHTKEPIYNSEF
jgi:hypothetical protein